MSANAKASVHPPDPGNIMRLSTAYWNAQTLLTANRMGIFDALADGPASAEELAEKLGVDSRGLQLFLNACVGLELCEKSGERFSNSRAAQAFLVSASPASMKNALAYTDDLYAAWGRLEECLRNGKPVHAAETYLGEDDKQTRHFVHGMHDRAMSIGRALPDVLDLGGRKRMLDVGGGPGTFSALLTERYDGLQSDVLELPGIAAVAEEILHASGADKRVRLLRGDYHSSDFGDGYDVVLMSGMFHRESADSCRKLIGKAHQCLEPGGLIVVIDVFTDDGGTTPAFAALFGLNMMLSAPDGGIHADADVERWMRDAGFSATQRKPFPPPMPHRIVTGTRS